MPQMTVGGTHPIPDAIERTRVRACLECGKCTSICPGHKAHPAFSPRDIVKKGILALTEGLPCDKDMWHCITCRLCKEVCVQNVDIPEFVRAVRRVARSKGNTGQETHDGLVQASCEILQEPGLKPDRLYWVEPDMKVKVDGTSTSGADVLLFVGCSPFFNIIFKEFDKNADIAKASVRVLNYLGVEPILLSDERCCGHDEHWTGDDAGFKNLRDLNMKRIKASGAKTIVTPCPECAYTLKDLYGLEGIEVLHMTQYLARHLMHVRSKPILGQLDIGSVAFHDPCRLGRFMREFDAPRVVLDAINGIKMKDMQFEGPIGRCCGVHAWISCTEGSRRARHDRMKEAQDAGADVLVTACPKCRIHFNCYLHSQSVEPVKIKVEDLTVLVAKAMGVFK
jgi:heterodisulfide reductase subunit D